MFYYVDSLANNKPSREKLEKLKNNHHETNCYIYPIDYGALFGL